MQEYDQVTAVLARYIAGPDVGSEESYLTASAALADAIGCAILSLSFPACTKLLGPVLPGTIVPQGSRVVGTSYCLDPVTAAFNMGAMIRWLDYNDTWLAAEWGHPSDNLGALLALADTLSRAGRPFSVKELLSAMIKAYEVQGILALDNSFNRVGYDHIILVKAASAAVTTQMLGGSETQIAAALTQAWADGGALRCYRQAPNTGSRKSWAAGDASARGLQLALLTMKGEEGYPTALTAPQWGLDEVMLRGEKLSLSQPLGSYVMENILFKISYPAEFHGQTAVEAAAALHPRLRDRFEEISEIRIYTQEAAIRIIDKQGSLNNPADRDHCLQYMVAVALLEGVLTADHYEAAFAADIRIDPLRAKMKVIEDPAYSRDYLDSSKRSIANRLEVYFGDGSVISEEVEYPLGHRRRRSEGISLLYEKCRSNLLSYYSQALAEEAMELFIDRPRLEAMNVDALISLLSKNK